MKDNNEKIKRELFCQIGMEFRMWYDGMMEQDEELSEDSIHFHTIEGILKAIVAIENLENKWR